MGDCNWELTDDSDLDYPYLHYLQVRATEGGMLRHVPTCTCAFARALRLRP